MKTRLFKGRGIVRLALAATLACLATSQASAAVTVSSEIGSTTTSITERRTDYFYPNANFTQNVQGTIVGKTLTALGSSTSYSYANGDVDDPSRGLFRFTQIITNATNQVLQSITLTLAGGSFANTSFSPAFVDVVVPAVGDASVTRLAGPNVTTYPNGYQIVLNGLNSITFLFGVDGLAPDEQVSIHTPFGGLPNSGGSFVLTMAATAVPEAVPEPASLALWSIFGLAATGVGLRRRRLAEDAC